MGRKILERETEREKEREKERERGREIGIGYLHPEKKSSFRWIFSY